MTAYLKTFRRRLGRWLHALAGRVDPGWSLPARYTAEHVMRYHELMIDTGLADAYDQAEPVPAGGGQGNGHPSAPPGGVRHQAAEAMGEAQKQAKQGQGISREQAQKIREAFIGEIERLNLIILDIDEDQASDIPIDVTLQALQHFVPVYAAATAALIGTGNGTT